MFRASGAEVRQYQAIHGDRGNKESKDTELVSQLGNTKQKQLRNKMILMTKVKKLIF